MPAPDTMRPFEDMRTARRWLKEDTLSALSKSFPIEDDEYRLELADVGIDGREDYGLARQKNALMKDDQLRIPIRGTWNLTHKPTGELLDSKSGTVMHLPFVSDRGTIIYNGNEYSSVSQMRLRPGVYSRRKKSGEVEAMYNIRPGTGKSFRTYLEPTTGVIKAHIGQANIPVYPLMRAMGATDEDMQQAWGKDIWSINRAANARGAMQKYYEKLVRKREPDATEQEQSEAVRAALSEAAMESDVNARTLGMEAADRVSPALLLRSTAKLLAINRGEEKEDDRDHPQYGDVYSIEDHISERVTKDAGGLAKSLLWKARRDRNLKRVHPGALSPYVQSYMLGSRLAMPLEETNPLSLLEQLGRVTKLGEGGISSADSVTDSARNVNPGQLGFIDPILGPESSAIGIDTRVAYKTFKGRDRKLYGEFTDKAGETVYLTPADVAGKTVAFPGQMARPGDTAVASVNGEVREVPKDQVELSVPSFAHMMSANVNLNPMPTALQAARQFYGAKFWGQYMPQTHGEAPLVVSKMPDSDLSSGQYYGKMIGTLRTPEAGTVTRVTDDKVVVTTDSGAKQEYDLVKDLPFNRMTSVSYRAAVEKGQRVGPDDVVARSNFVDDENEIRLGRNLNVAVIPYKGNSIEDGVVISESAAKKMATDRLFGVDKEARNGVTLGRDKYASLFPGRFSQDQLKNMDDDGIVKPGTLLQKGDPLILSTGPKLLTAEDVQLGKLHKALRNAHKDMAETWEHDYEGRVTDAVRTRSGAKVNVAASVPMDVGDKISPRAGLKGVIAKVVPDDKMPRAAATDEPYDVMINPMTILSRVAASALIEMQLGKVARKTGKRFILPQEAPEEGWNAWALNQLKEAGVPEKEDVFDPELGRVLRKPVATGTMYMSAFHHLSEKKMGARGGFEGGFTQDELPSKGGGETAQAKRMSGMDNLQLLSHGAKDVMRDALAIRGAKNENYFKALRLGMPLPAPETPFVYNKFMNLLKSSGINIEQKGHILKLLPMTDDDVTKLSRGPIKSGAMLDRNMMPIAGGLFDPGRTGGAAGKNWSHIELTDPMPNPVFEEPIRRLLGLRVKDYEDIIAGRQELNGATGGAAIRDALGAIDIDAQIARNRQLAKSQRGANRDNAIKSLGYLAAAKANNINPASWVMTKLPVLPPVFRPVTKAGDTTINADLNDLYRDLIEVNNAVSDLRKDLPDSAITDEREALYRSVKAVVGLGDPITPEGRSMRLKGGIRQIVGDNPKRGLLQSKVLSKPVGMVGRGVISPDPSLDMDTVGIPEDGAWKVYKDLVIRRLVKSNYPVHKALEMIEARTPQAKSALLDEMAVRPVLMDRAPTWHKFNLMAFRPVLTEGHSIKMPPLVLKGFTADFDGDQMNFHVPVDDKAVAQAYEKMLPSKNLFSLTDLESPRHTPQQELSLGLYLMTRPEVKGMHAKTFRTAAEAKLAYRRGEIGANDPVEILEE